MKNSLFKRAIAAAAAVPLALTQCLTFANAVESDTATTTANVQAQSQESTLKAFLAIPGDSDILAAPEKGAEYNIQKSTWEQSALFLLNDLSANHNKGTIDLTPYITKVVANAGAYSDVAKVFADLVDGKKVDYTFDGKKLTVKGKINELNYNEFIGVSDAFKIDAFDDIVLGGDFVIVVDGSTIDANQTVTAEFKYTCEGKTYTLGEVPALIKDKFTAIKAKAEKEIGAGVDEKAKADFFDKLDKIIKVATKADNGVTKALSLDWNYTTAQEKGNAADAITKLNAKLKSFGINKQLPPTASDIASDSRAAAAFAELSEKTNGKVTVSAAEVGKLADEIGGRSISKDSKTVVSTDLSTLISGGVGSFTAAFDDDADEVADLKKKVEAQGYQLVGSYKKVYANVDFSNIKKDGKATLKLDLNRVLVTDTTTTTTSTTTSSTTTSSTTTSSTTSSSTSSSTTSSSTTTSTTSSSTTTSTTTTPPDTKKIKKQYAKAGYKTTAAFYLNTEEEFNKKQISNVALVIEYTDGTSEERTVAAGDINFGTAKPTNTYEKGNTTFKYDVPVFVKDTALTDADGKAITVEAYIGVRGDADLNNTANAVDASVVLTYYAKLQTGGKAARTQLSTSPLVKAASDIYDDFAAYLADVYYDVENGVIFDNLTDKATRKNTINAVDASSILQFYAKRQVSDNQNKSDAVLWADVDANIGNSESNQ